MSTVRIVTDSACDLPDALVRERGITVVPLTIRFGDEDLVDREQLSTQEFWSRCAASSELPQTAAPAPGAFEAAYRRLAAEGARGIVVVNLSSALSATMQSALLAAEAVADVIEVEVVDSRSVTIGLGMTVLAAEELAATGASVTEVAAHARDVAARTKVWGALDTLENLRKGGRIGGAKALVASVLSIKPIIEVRDGKVEEGGKQRTRAKALAMLVETVRANLPLERLAVMHADVDDVDVFVGRLREIYAGEIVVGEIGPVIGTHAGRGTIGVAFRRPG